MLLSLRTSASTRSSIWAEMRCVFLFIWQHHNPWGGSRDETCVSYYLTTSDKLRWVDSSVGFVPFCVNHRVRWTAPSFVHWYAWPQKQVFKDALFTTGWHKSVWCASSLCWICLKETGRMSEWGKGIWAGLMSTWGTMEPHGQACSGRYLFSPHVSETLATQDNWQGEPWKWVWGIESCSGICMSFLAKVSSGSPVDSSSRG